MSIDDFQRDVARVVHSRRTYRWAFCWTFGAPPLCKAGRGGHHPALRGEDFCRVHGGRLPQYAAGIDYAPTTGPAMIHAREAVLSPAEAAEYRARSITLRIPQDPPTWFKEIIGTQLGLAFRRAKMRERSRELYVWAFGS